MTVRKIVKIDEEKCNGCGECIINCPEGALKIIDGKAKMVKESYCDGLGACIGKCPLGAITIEEREADAFDEAAANANMEAAKKTPSSCPGSATRTISLPLGGCPGSMVRKLNTGASSQQNNRPQQSQLSHWPVQLALVPPQAAFLKDAEILLVADCVPFALADFHQRLLAGGHPVLVACPKLDDTNPYIEKLAEIFRVSEIKKLTIVHMEVPCCGGLGRVVKAALEISGMEIPIDDITVSIDGNIIE